MNASDARALAKKAHLNYVNAQCLAARATLHHFIEVAAEAGNLETSWTYPDQAIREEVYADLESYLEGLGFKVHISAGLLVVSWS